MINNVYEDVHRIKCKRNGLSENESNMLEAVDRWIETIETASQDAFGN